MRHSAIWRIRWFVALGAVLSVRAGPETETAWPLTNGRLQLQVERQGAIISDLRLTEGPASWLSQSHGPDSAAPFAHFLCFDRWGPVTPSEQAAGFNFHGEAGRIPWWLAQTPASDQVTLQVTLPLAGLTARRQTRLHPVAAGFEIQTRVHNPTTEVRPYNVVEHITLADAWADASIRVVTNAREGLLHRNGERVADAQVEWPWVVQGDVRWDLREVNGRRGRFIASLRFPAGTEWGYVALQDPRTGALLAYVWRADTLPWLNLYWFTNGTRGVQRAIEPGTTGLHRPMAELLTTAPILDRPVVHWLAPAQERSFLVRGGLGVGPDGFGILKNMRVNRLGWFAVDEAGRELLLVPQFADRMPGR